MHRLHQKGRMRLIKREKGGSSVSLESHAHVSANVTLARTSSRLLRLWDGQWLISPSCPPTIITVIGKYTPIRHLC